jgi:AcrR family transcriptional regulator
MPTSRPYHHGDLREALLAAGLGLLVEQGAHGLSLREAARRAGVSHNAPYKHFPTREALLAGLAERGFRKLAKRTAAASKPSTKEPAVARGIAYVEFALENPALFRLMFSDAIDRKAFPEVQAAATEGLARLGGFVGDLYGEESIDEVMIAAWAFVHGLAQLILDDQIPKTLAGVSKRKLAQRVIETMNHALQGAQRRAR